LRVGQPQKALQDCNTAYQIRPSSTVFIFLKFFEKKKNRKINFFYFSGLLEEGKFLLKNEAFDQTTLNELDRGEICCSLLRNASRSLGSRLENDFECVLCLKLFYEPATLPCGHTFCRSCIGQATLFNNKCPLCRTVFHSNFKPPVTVSLKNIIEKRIFPLFPFLSLSSSDLLSFFASSFP